MDPGRTAAIKHWFEQLLKAKLNVDPVDGWAPLYKRHIAIITHLITTGHFELCEEKTSHDAYTKTYQALQNQTVEMALLEHLKPDSAATGDNFEVAKFLVVLLNELRISQPVLFSQGYGLTEEETKNIAAILHYLDDQQNWDRFESWPALLFQKSDETTTDPRTFITPKIRRPNRCDITMREKLETRRSPLSEIVSSPRSCELRKSREKDKQITALNNRCKQFEFDKDDLESALKAAMQETSRLTKSISEVTGLANEKEAQCQAMSAELDDWRSKAAGTEDEVNQLKRQLKAAKHELSTTQRQLREAEYDVSLKQNSVDSWQKAATWEEQERLKLEREREEFLQELADARNKKSAVEEQLRQRITGDEAEITELRNITEGLRSEVKETRQERDKAMKSQDEMLDGIRKETDQKMRNKESEIVQLSGIIEEMKKQLSSAQLSLKDVRNTALQVWNLGRELENRCVEIQGLRLIFAIVQNGCLTLQQGKAQQKAMIESLRNNAAISECRSKALAASLKDQQRKHMEAMAAKQEILTEREKMLHDAWNQLHNSADLNTRLREELTQRDVAHQVLLQCLASAEERCSTISQRFSSVSSIVDCKSAGDTMRTNSHFSEAKDVSFSVLPHEFHPLPEVEDENDLLSSTSVYGNPYKLNVEAQCGRPIANEIPELNASVDTERLAELNRRNKTLSPHLRSTYPMELQHLSLNSPDEKALKSSESCVTPKKGDDMSSLVASCSLSKKTYASRSLRSVKRRFRKMLRETNVTVKQRTTGSAGRSPFKQKN